MTSAEMLARNQEMIDLRREGWSLEDIGNRFDVSRERVRQITAPIVPYEEVREIRRAPIEELITRMNAEGRTDREIARQLGLHQSMVSAMRRDLQLPRNSSKYWTRERILEVLREFHKETGIWPTSPYFLCGDIRQISEKHRELNVRFGLPAYGTIRDVFPSLREALAAAGDPAARTRGGNHIIKKCRGCGCDFNDRTPSCVNCHNRHSARAKRIRDTKGLSR